MRIASQGKVTISQVFLSTLCVAMISIINMFCFIGSMNQSTAWIDR
ncbi:rCG28818 [Rattus norvegicus]|uniref:RCG28818 n=1 Tax=Rattus norvegicus TaxID=10116 RepID=A6HWI1_RAT|nr:rCG28818 [Rattus norvegicus]